MDTLSVAQTKNTLSQQLRKIDDNPVRITNNGKPVAVIISDVRYQEMKRIEDLLYAKMADIAFEEGFASEEDTEALMAKIRSHA